MAQYQYPGDLAANTVARASDVNARVQGLMAAANNVDGTQIQSGVVALPHLTATLAAQVLQSGVLPASPATYQPWIDTGVTGGVLKHWTGTAWRVYPALDLANAFTGANTFSQIQSMLGLLLTGLTGATGTGRFVGFTAAAGAPTTGTFAVGDWAFDSFTPTIWVCITAGTPGTWGPLYFPDRYIPLWISSGTYAVITATAAGTYLEKSINSGVTSGNGRLLYTVPASALTLQRYAFEATLWGVGGVVVYAELWDLTEGTMVTGSQITVSATQPTVTRSGSFTLTPGHVYGVTCWTSNSSYAAYITDASLIVQNR